MNVIFIVTLTGHYFHNSMLSHDTPINATDAQSTKQMIVLEVVLYT